MERNKMEDDFREKLNKREILPSNHAWDRLDAMLTAVEEKKPKSNYTWLFIAAGFVGLLLMATLFFKTNNPQDAIKNDVVIENNKVEETPNKTQVNEPLIPQVAPETQVALETEKPSKVDERISDKKQVATPIKANQNQIAENKPNKNLKLDIPNNVSSQAVAVQDVQIDKLLDNTMSNDKVFLKQVIKVDANALLSQVDGELDSSFRERALQIVTKNYKSVKVALSTRNDQ